MKGAWYPFGIGLKIAIARLLIYIIFDLPVMLVAALLGAAGSILLFIAIPVGWFVTGLVILRFKDWIFRR
jgi:hypothetical protein